MPRIIEESREIYSYEELSEEAKSNARWGEMEDYPEDILYEIMEDIGKAYLGDTLKQAQFERVSYDLSYSQGSGAVIEFKYTNLADFVKDFPEVDKYLNNKLPNYKKEAELDSLYFKFSCKCDNRYCFEVLDYTVDGYDDYTDNLCNWLDEYLYENISTRGGRSNGNIAEIIKDIQKEYTSKCYEAYEGLYSKPEDFEDMWFYSDGTFAYWEEDLQ